MGESRHLPAIDEFFVRTIKEMPFPIVKQLAESKLVHIPFDLVGKPEDIAWYLLSQFDETSRARIVEEYGDAGHALIYYFTNGKPIPSMEALKEKSMSILSLSQASPLIDNIPYFEDIDIDEFSQTFRARFHYFKGTVFLLDPKTKLISQERRAYYGVVVYRPRKRLVEVRAKHRDVARTAAVKTGAIIGLNQSMDNLNFKNQDFIKSFLGWIRTLNNARIGLSTRGALSSITMSSKDGTDLRSVKDFQKYLEEGLLRGGHATITEETEVNFRIFFRECRVYFTSFCNEADVELVTEVLEKISSGFRYSTPERLIDEFFK